MTVKKANPKHDFDLNWKIVLDGLFEEFVAFFLPSLYPKVDFSYKPVSLEKEFHKLVFDESKKGNVHNDKLMKVKLLDGNFHFLLIHIEVQSRREHDFPERMFKYFYRIRDKYKQPVTAIAIYTKEGVPNDYDCYKYECEGTELTYRFNAFKVIDANRKSLLDSNNPFALVVLASQYLNETMTDAERRYKLKLKLIDLAQERQYTTEQISRLLTFIEFMLILPKDLQLKYEQESLEKFENVMVATEAQRRFINFMSKNFLGESYDELDKKLSIREEELAIRDEALATRKEELKKSAIKLLKMGLSPHKVREIINLPLEEIERLARSL